jgi:hypothetical protein
MLPSVGRDHHVALSSIALRLIDFETGAQLAGKVVLEQELDALRSCPGGDRNSAITSDIDLTWLEVSPGLIHVTGTDPASKGTAAVRLHLQPGESQQVELYLTPIATRRFETSGLAPGDVVRWSATRGSRTAEGQLFVFGSGDVETNVPDGPVRFERLRAEQVSAVPIDLVVLADPIQLRW